MGFTCFSLPPYIAQPLQNLARTAAMHALRRSPRSQTPLPATRLLAVRAATARLLAGLVVLGLLAAGTGGCAASKGVSLRSVPRNPLAEQLKLGSRTGPEPSARTVQVLRFWNLQDQLDGDIRDLLAQLQVIADRQPSAERVYAIAELAYLGGKRVEKTSPAVATDLFGSAVLYSYRFLFDPRFELLRSPYDPQFRGACDLYNAALEDLLRLVCADKKLVPGTTQTVRTAAGECNITLVLRGGRWRPQDFDHFEFVSDYEIRGLKNHYRRHGLGVPLIAVRRSYEGEPAVAKYYPVDLSFPVTAFLRPVAPQHPDAAHSACRHQALLELYDPLAAEETPVAGRRVPLEADLSTPLAFFLSKPELEALAWVGLLKPQELMKMRPDRPDPIMGLYMAQPYEPGKIPVLLVHGLWSSPMTWMEMFNDLRAQPEICERYQFWFYLYPTGQPFWISAAQLRADLDEARQLLDPMHREPALDQMVLIGHSMGGLISKLQVSHSRDDFWELASTHPFEEVEADPEVRQKLHYAFFFKPSPSIRRVITIATPHRGSQFSNQTTQWLLSKLIRLPRVLVKNQQKLFRENKGAFPENSILKVHNSIDALAPDSPIFPVMLAERPPPWVTYHNIVGITPDNWWLNPFVRDSDGVVSRDSAELPEAASELVVRADHSTVHAHPAAVLEVRRVLLSHLAELEGRPAVAAHTETATAAH